VAAAFEGVEMEFLARGVPVHFVEHGEGAPVLVLHGAGVDHREPMGALEPVFAASPGLRRIYPDLPGMGGTPAPESLTGSDDVLEVLLAFVDGVTGGAPFLLVGHSAGAYFARAIAAARPDRLAGLALLCPLGTTTRDVPAHEAVLVSVDADGTLDADDAREFRDYFVVQTPETLERFTTRVLPGMRLADAAAAERMGQNWMLSVDPDAGPPSPHPTLIVAGRQDATVGYASAADLLPRYPRATLAVLDRAGHALPHEQPELLGALVAEWLERVRA
jgi:pimeloyl-ACP methyl ester carboxylesterase